MGLSVKVYEKLRSGISFDDHVLFIQLSANMHDVLSVGGESSIDETMLPFQGDSDHIAYLPRKPHDTVIRLYLHCFELHNTKQPVCFTAMPDTQRSTLTSVQVLREMTSHHPVDTKVSITADAFFSSTGWLTTSIIPTLFSMSSNDIAMLLPLFTHDLKYHQHRMFLNGHTLLSFWHDNSMMICGSNRFTVGAIPQDRKKVVNMGLTKPIMTEEDLAKLASSRTRP